MICICGLPATGKSTVITHLQTILDSNTFKFDDFLDNNCTYQEAKTQFYQAIEYYNTQKPLILEHTFQHKSSRKKVKIACTTAQIPSLFIVLKCSISVLTTRNAARTTPISQKSIQNIINQWEDAPEAIELDTEVLSPEKISAQILTLFREKTQNFKPKILQNTQNSEILDLDLQSRALTKAFIKEKKLEKFGKFVNEKRREWLMESGEIDKLEGYLVRYGGGQGVEGSEYVV